MSPEAQRIAIAEACGWKLDGEHVWFPSGTRTNRFQSSFDGGGEDDLLLRIIPDYLNDLNAMHEAEKRLTFDQSVIFRLALSRNSDGRNAHFSSVEGAMCHATAAQRAEAFLKTLGLWTP